MRRWIAMLICIASLSALTITASAHSGRTDSKGGHWNRSTGEYHYHHGYSAHQHKDMDGDGKLDCPYEFNNKTSTQQKISVDVPSLPKSSGSGYTKPTETVKPTEPVKSVKNQNTANDGVITFLLFVTILESIVIVGLAFSCRNKNYEIYTMRQRHSETIKSMEQDFEEKTASMIEGVKELSELESKIKTSHGNLVDIISQINSKKDALKFWESEKEKAKLEVDKIRESGVLEKEKTLLDIARIKNAPPDVSFAKDGYPIYWEYLPSKPYGDYTVYYNPRGQVYHLDRICSPYFAIEMHLFKAIPLGRPCKKCAKKYQDFKIPEWFTDPKK